MSTSVLYDVPGPQARRRVLLQSVIGGVLLVALLAVVFARLSSKGQLEGERWEVLGNTQVLELLLRGLVNTLRVAGIAMLLSLVVGVLLAVGRLSEHRWVRALVRTWVEFFRGLPLLLLILFIYLGAPALGVNLPVLWALVLGLTLYNSAVVAEIVRAGILSLPRGQREAAYAIGLRPGQAMRLVLLPQAFRLMLPALISQLVTLLKDTSLGFVISYPELLRSGRTVVEFLGGRFSLPIYVAVAVIYIAINMALSWLARWVDRRPDRQRLTAGPPATARPGQPAGAALADEAA